MPDTHEPVILRMIASPTDSAAILSRLCILCGEQGMAYTVTQDEPY